MARPSDYSGDWLATYADFITLLLIFFVLLYTLTPGIEQNKFESIIGAFQQNDGILEHRAVMDVDPLDVKIKRAQNWQDVQRYIMEEGLADQVQVDLLDNGIRITLGEAVAFDTYSADLRNAAKDILYKIGDNIYEYAAEDLKEIEVAGYTDNRPVRQGAVLFKSNWELGAARATSVLSFLLNNTSIDGEYFKASSYGPYRPRTTNETPEGRRQNRRVEVNILYHEPGEEGPSETEERQKMESIKLEYGRADTTS